MKDLKKKISALVLACTMLTGCGQVVQNMGDIPAISKNITETSTGIQTTETTKKGYVAGAVVTTAVSTDEVSKVSNVTATSAYVAGGSTVTDITKTTVHSSGVQYGTTHIVPVNPNLDISAFTTKTTAPETIVTTIANASPETTTTTTTTCITTTIITETAKKPDTPQELIEQMSLEEKVYQMFMVKPEQITGVYPTTASGETTKNAIAEYPVGGIIYFADNLVSVPQTQSMLENVQKYAKESSNVGIFTAVDEEGGIVARAAQRLGTTPFRNMKYYGDKNDVNEGYSVGYTIGSDLRRLGFNVDFAPVADVNINENNELGERIFSSDPFIVANMATAVATGLQDAGVSATLKHFPGLGAEDGNTHEDSFVVIDRTVDQLRESEFVPFRKGIENGVDFVMVSHQIVTGFGDNLPADLSYKAVTEYLREELGFDGIAITDSQQMNTISTVYSSGESAVMSIQAGIDIILMPENLQEAVNAVCDAVNNGTISEERIDESVSRILNKKYELGLF